MRTSPMSFTDRDEARFWSKVALPNTNGCMLWLASRTTTGGYGCFGVAGKTRRAHRVAYELTFGPIPNGLVVDHLCRVRHCVNPDHLEVVTQAENHRRGVPHPASLLSSAAHLGGLATGALSRAKTHCPQGHPYSEENTYVAPKGDRRCRACAKAHRTAHRTAM